MEESEKRMLDSGHRFKVVCKEKGTVRYFRVLADAAVYCAFMRGESGAKKYSLLHTATGKPVSLKQVSDACYAEVQHRIEAVNRRLGTRWMRLVNPSFWRKTKMYKIEIRGRPASGIYSYKETHCLYEELVKIWKTRKIEEMLAAADFFP